MASSNSRGYIGKIARTEKTLARKQLKRIVHVEGCDPDSSQLVTKVGFDDIRRIWMHVRSVGHGMRCYCEATAKPRMAL